jgi:hypothetical protein
LQDAALLSHWAFPGGNLNEIGGGAGGAGGADMYESGAGGADHWGNEEDEEDDGGERGGVWSDPGTHTLLYDALLNTSCKVFSCIM